MDEMPKVFPCKHDSETGKTAEHVRELNLLIRALLIGVTVSKCTKKLKNV